MLQSDARPKWISFHAFVGSGADQDLFLVNTIVPVVEKLREEFPDLRFFFLRYWNGGPHLRLRFAAAQLDAERSQDELYAVDGLSTPARDMEKEAEAYAAMVARMSDVDEQLRNNNRHIPETIEPFQAPGSIQLRPYNTDFVRFGGTRASTFAEDHFCISSALALSLIASSLDRPALLAVGLHLGTATLLSQGWDFGVARCWLENRDKIRTILYPETKDTSIVALGYWTFEEQVDVLGPVIDQIRNADASAWRLPIVALWRREIEQRIKLVTSVRDEHAPPTYEIAMDFLHLFFNRLGILTADEMYIYHLLARALSSEDAITVSIPRFVTG